MQHFENTFMAYDWQEVGTNLTNRTATDVQHALTKRKRSIKDFLSLISPAATPFLEQMARLSKSLTQQRFGKTIQLYAPLYLSNECQNICTYCGFSMNNHIKRKTLSSTEILIEAMALKAMGIKHVLLVSGEANRTVGFDYIRNAVTLLLPYFTHISIEVQPLSYKEYLDLHQIGVHSVLVYQETYHRNIYRQYHPKGKKSNFDYRLDTPDRIGKAGFHKIGLGVLLGLEDWRIDSFFNALHISYLQKTYWQTNYSVSFPRLRPAAGVIGPKFVMEDRDLLQLICAYRIWNPDLELSVSTRENEKFRNHVITLGATTMSAASKTNPGGYAVDQESLEQFETNDERSMETFKEIIKGKGYDPVMKDWEATYSSPIKPQ